MTYSQKANPNATNSELDAKVIIKHPTLTSNQRYDKLKDILWNTKLTHSERVEKIKKLKEVK